MSGYIYEIADFEREYMGLPKAPEVKLSDVKEIIKITGLDELWGSSQKEG